MATTEKVAEAEPKATEAKAEKKAEPKRKVLTAAERVAKLEAELAAARKKAEEKANKERDQLTSRKAELVKRRDGLNVSIAEIDKALENLKPKQG